MDQKAIETKAVNAVRDIIVESAYLDQSIPDNDKEPSFDGFIYIYSKPGKKKSDYVDRIAVQVKGTQKKVASKATEVKHRVDMSDLRIYLNEGGVVYFVVHLSSDGKTKRIFYEELLPIKIRRILDDADGQATTTLKFKPFPTDATLLRGLFTSFLEHQRKQAILHDIKEIPNIDDLQKSGQLKNITLTTAGSRSYDNPIEALLNDDVYVYATINGSEAHYPVDLINNTVERTVFHYADKRISINGQEFYKRYEVHEFIDKIIHKYGESVTITFHRAASAPTIVKAELNYKPCDSMRQRVTDLDFFISFVEAGGIEVDGVFVNLSLDSNSQLEEHKNELKYLKRAVKALDILHIAEDIDIKSMTETDFRELGILIKAFVDKQPICNVRKDLPLIYIASVSNLKIALVHTEEDEPENMSKIYDLFGDNFVFGFTLSDESDSPQHFVPPCANFDKAIWGAISNIYHEDIAPSFKRMYNQYKDKHVFLVANMTLLSILLAYDETKKKPLLYVAQQLSEWLLMNCTDEILSHHILTLNHLQSIKRSRELNKEERKQLLNIAEYPKVDSQIKIGAYILLDNQEAADLHFEQLDSALQNSFFEWPIYNLWNRTTVSEDDQDVLENTSHS